MEDGKEFNERVKNFIKLLKTTKIKDCFNPWNETNKKDNKKDAAEIRCNNLENYLLERKNAKYVVIGEAPSYGARYTGIAMTSECVMYENPKIFPEKTYKRTSLIIHTEKTASIIWDEILKIDKSGKDFVIWYAFAYHNKDAEYIKNPTIKQITDEKNLKILRMFLKLFPEGKIIVLGRKAQQAIGYALSSYIRHPSCGGEKMFRKDFKTCLKK